ncbi:hypothetical protein O7626_15235 [Micromonospora sp. WMMD1102]|uniref:hypothetical protein n=1 Tax=Micromonospora sp. WMMD1102 TaxID=3016105 RepID=UPI002414DBC4|nr:hypothetical protein [Micromonospora sp. WMMD1102]MDG4787267.1 hypothetical protein [Micromonospora sp. WMMD1102]
MDTLLGMLIVGGGLGVLLTGFAWLARHVRRSGVGAQVMGPIDEAWNPGAHRWRQEIEVQEQRVLPSANADDHPRLGPRFR